MTDVLKQRVWLLAVLVLLLPTTGIVALWSRHDGSDVRAAATSTSTTARPATTTTTTTSTTTTTAPPVTDPPPTEPPATDPPAAAPRATYPPPTDPPATEPPAADPVTPAAAFDTGAAGQIVGYMNGLRSSVGAGPLGYDGCLTALAQGWAQSMGDRQSMTHNPGFASCNGTAGENIGTWSPCNAAAMDAWWNASPGHHANMVNPAYGSVGVGVYEDGSGACWYVVDFGP